MVKIRLQRCGAKKRPFYRIVAIDHRKRRDGAVLENLGQYQPIVTGQELLLKKEEILEWLKKGAQPSNTVLNLLKKEGLWATFKSGSAGQE